MPVWGSFTFQWAWCGEFWLVVRFPQVCVQTVMVADEHLISLNGASARNLSFLDREEEIIYPWTREGKGCRQIEHGN